ncbi:MAG TPA: uracil-DNA glycosylase [Actinomycetes bacterium]|nr:uracil-DNA glycosylase [Actinomycetes bacterium]
MTQAPVAPAPAAPGPSAPAPAALAPAALAPTMAGWPELVEAVTRCTVCAELAAGRTRVVPGVYPPGADVLLIGEAPGAQEDLSGVPFVGKAGHVLDTLLAAAGLPRERIAVANVLKCRPPGNRKPKRAEMAACTPWLDRQLEVIDPVLVVTLGGTAAEWALGAGTKIASARTAIHPFRGRSLLVTYHPSAAVRFGPNGAPMRALREDLTTAARLAERLRGERLRAGRTRAGRTRAGR